MLGFIFGILVGFGVKMAYDFFQEERIPTDLGMAQGRAEAIMDEIAEGAPEAQRVVDRQAAIERAIGLAAAGDVVVVAGKGHERYQEFEDGRTVPFDDVAVAREALRARVVA